jgi:hypothetical protein
MLVLQDLRVPVRSVGVCLCAMKGAAMPEAAIDEDRESGTREHYVSLPTQAG